MSPSSPVHLSPFKVRITMSFNAQPQATVKSCIPARVQLFQIPSSNGLILADWPRCWLQRFEWFDIDRLATMLVAKVTSSADGRANGSNTKWAQKERMWQYMAFTMMQGLMSRLFEKWRATQFETCLHRCIIKKWATQMGFYVHSAWAASMSKPMKKASMK